MSFELDQLEASGEGAWVDFVTGEEVKESDPGRLEVLIGSTATREFRQELARRTKLTRRQLRQLRKQGQLDAQELDKVQVELYADHVLLGWRHATKGGTDYAYSRENAIALLTEMPKFRDRIEEIVDERDDFLGELQEELEGN